MKKIIFLIIISSNFFLRAEKVNCQTLDYNENTIVYILPNEVCRLLEKELKEDSTRIYFKLGMQDNVFTIVKLEKNNGRKDFSVKTNRKIFLKKHFYPLVFETDFLFGVVDSASEILQRSKQEKYITFGKIFPLYHNYFSISFNKDGDILKSGYTF